MADDQAAVATGLAAVVGPVWSEAKVCASLGVTAEVLAARREAGDVLALVTSDGVSLYPVWQFARRSGLVEVKPALIDVFRALREHDSWAVAVLLHTPAPELDGSTPLDWLATGNDPAAVMELAHVVGREWKAGAA